jgi:hypothetical protein
LLKLSVTLGIGAVGVETVCVGAVGDVGLGAGTVGLGAVDASCVAAVVLEQ